MATIHDIAKLAGVSTSTVSHVVNKTRFVSPELEERVNNAIKSLDSPPNFVIKKSGKYHNTISIKYILLLISDSNSYFQKEAANLIEATGNSKYSFITVNYGTDENKIQVISETFLSSSSLAGIIVFPDEDDTIFQKALNRVQVPIIVIGRDTPGTQADMILSDNFKGAYKAVRHLVNSGHENIVFLSSAPQDTSDRINGYKQALTEYGIKPSDEMIITGQTDTKQIIFILDQLLGGAQPPTAVFAANYSVIFPLFQYIESHNIICPDDLSVVVFNDFDWAALHHPPVTTVKQNTEEIAGKALELLQRRLDGEDFPPQEITIPTILNVRRSTCGIGRGPFGEKAESADSLVLTQSEIEFLNKQDYTAAVSFHYTGKAWMDLHQKGMKDIFDMLGISLIAITDAHFEPELQCKQLKSLEILEPDIIIACPTDNTQTSEAFKNIAAGKSSLILITNIPDGLTRNDYVTCVSVNEHSHGRFIGQGLAEYMLRHNLKNIGFIRHNANFYATSQRDKAAEQILTEEYPELSICGTASFENEEEVYKKTLELIHRHPEIEGLYISWDGPAIQAMNALSEANRSDIVISTADLDYTSATNMAKGGMIKAISAQCPYEQGQAMAMAAANALLGKKTPSFIGIEPIYVTPDNLLKSWKKVFKEDPGTELKKAFKENPNYIPS